MTVNTSCFYVVHVVNGITLKEFVGSKRKFYFKYYTVQNCNRFYSRIKRARLLKLAAVLILLNCKINNQLKQNNREKRRRLMKNPPAKKVLLMRLRLKTKLRIRLKTKLTLKTRLRIRVQQQSLSHHQKKVKVRINQNRVKRSKKMLLLKRNNKLNGQPYNTIIFFLN